jgi:uncharacterized membrane protein (UPF0182 family)
MNADAATSLIAKCSGAASGRHADFCRRREISGYNANLSNELFPKEGQMKNRLTWVIILLVVFLLAGGLSFAVGMYFDWLWFQELGKTVLFTTALYAKGMLFTAVLCPVFLFLYVNLLVAHRSPGAIKIGIPTPDGHITAYTFEPALVQRVIGLAALVVGFLLALRVAGQWEIIWQWRNRVGFGVQDPVFSRDISFYFFTLPLLEGLVRLGLVLCFAAAAGILLLYYFKGSFSLRMVRMSQRGRAISHVSILLGFLFLLLAISAYLDRFGLLFSRHQLIYGASYADLSARLPVLSILMVTALIGAVLWFVNAFVAKYRYAVLAAGLYIAVLLGGNIYPALVQSFVVAPNELSRESAQIEHNINATLRAYNLENIQERDLSGDKALTPQDIQANAATIQSIRLWDHGPLLDAFSQIQEIRTYYSFLSVDNDRYQIKGVPQQMMLSPREMDSANLQERNWINEHLAFTHGYGLTLGPVNRVTIEGLPVLHVKDIPPKSGEPIFEIRRPEIYYGEGTKGYAIVRTDYSEFDYPAGEQNVSTTYQGIGGVPIRSFFRKLLFAFYFRDVNIVLSPMLKADSRFLYFRDLRSRFSRLVPFLLLDQDPYMVISDGKLFWVQDAYTRSNRYPYSTPTDGVGNYMRNSVKLVMDAYNGTVDMYVADPADPLIQVYQRIFPGAFQPLSAMPPDLRAHIRYPEDIFRIQTYIYSAYHMNRPPIFYNKEDLWEIPSIATAGSQQVMSPYYTIMRLPQEKQEEFILMLPFTPARKPNLSAWIVARSDGDRYGQLVVYRFPKQKLVYGPSQIVARINQDAEISRQLSLWDQRGSQVIQGTLLVIPIEEALLYVRPLYLRGESAKIPELKRVIVAYENKIAMEETLEAAISRIFADGGPPPAVTEKVAAPSGPATPSNLIRQAGEAYDRAIQAQRQGDWATYGEELKKLGALLQQLQKK